MTTEAMDGWGVQLKIRTQVTPSVEFTQVAELTNLTPFGLSRDVIDATHAQSPDKWREKIRGLKDAGAAEAEVNFVPGSATTALLMSEFNREDGYTVVQIVFPDDSEVEIDCILSDFSPEVPVDDKMTASFTLTISGAVAAPELPTG